MIPLGLNCKFDHLFLNLLFFNQFFLSVVFRSVLPSSPVQWQSCHRLWFQEVEKEYILLYQLSKTLNCWQSHKFLCLSAYQFQFEAVEMRFVLTFEDIKLPAQWQTCRRLRFQEVEKEYILLYQLPKTLYCWQSHKYF